MNLSFDLRVGSKYKSQTQKIRVISESWVRSQIYCPGCGQSSIEKYSNNTPVADFHCLRCQEDYELKSKKGSVGKKIVDGAYRAMMDKLQSNNAPNFFFLNYNPKKYEVIDFLVIPKHFFIPEIIEKRNPLAPKTQRAGWVGCNILLQNIPATGKIYLIRNQIVEPKVNVRSVWKKTLFLREEKEISSKGWLLDIMKCVETFGKSEFSLDQIYRFRDELSNKHPDNKHINDKIRQQLQVLRDKGYLDFVQRGRYRLTK